jgi:TonB-linked SusC/RagA family outer membrane protein
VIYAQSDLTVGGLVMTGDGEAIVGVTISVREAPGKGTMTDGDGRFKMTGIAAGQTLVFNYLGYMPVEMAVARSDERMRVVMTEDINTMEEVVVVGRGTQRRISITGAVTNVETSTLKVPATSLSNMLGGRVPGIISVTRSGEPGRDVSEFWIRGISTFGAGSSPLILIDGVSGGSLNDIDPEDVENFSILKDAASTAMYGNQGANGVILVTTKKGTAGKLNLNVKVNAGLSHSPRMPDYVDANTYAALANEAAVSRGMNPIFNDVDLALFKSGMDPDLHPNVNWRDVILKDFTWNQQYFLSASGGGQAARYYISLGIMNKDAIFKQDSAIKNKYNTNVDYNKYNFRANVDVNLTPTSVLTLGLENIIVAQNYPGYGNDSKVLWQAQANITPVTVPIVYSSGETPSYGSSGGMISPYVLLNQTGYRKYYRNTNNLNIQFNQDLKGLTEGLSFSVLFNMHANAQRWSERTKIPALYFANDRKRDGTLNLQKISDLREPAYNRSTEVDRKFYLEGRINYERVFADKHRVSLLLHTYIEDYESTRFATDLTSIPKRYNNYSGRFTYAFQDTYFLEGNIGYTGSEAFEPGKKFGVFPAVSLGWVPTQYGFMKEKLPFLNFLKFRGSYGIVGNDKIIWDDSVRFPYLTTMRYTGLGNPWQQGFGITEDQVGSNNLRWEKASKANFGIDVTAFDQRFEATVDLFQDVRSGIYQQRADIPEEMGLISLPWANVGKMKSWGIDGHVSWTQTINKDAYVVVRANLTQSKNRVLEFEESGIRYPYSSAVGYQHGINRGLIALGLFRDEEDVRNSPRQVWESVVRPGDIKYKDVNGDGVVDDYDVVPLEYSNTPQIQYGMAGEFNWKNWNLSILFDGVSRVSYFSGGAGFFPFIGRETGNVLDLVAEQGNRWTAREISGTAATENPDARFPRLSYGGNANNNRNSTHWLNDGRYLRLKNLQLSYTTSMKFLTKIGIQSATISLIGDNLAVWDKVKIFDPAQASENGAEYPLQRVYTFQLNLKF